MDFSDLIRGICTELRGLSSLSILCLSIEDLVVLSVIQGHYFLNSCTASRGSLDCISFLHLDPHGTNYLMTVVFCGRRHVKIPSLI